MELKFTRYAVLYKMGLRPVEPECNSLYRCIFESFTVRAIRLSQSDWCSNVVGALI